MSLDSTLKVIGKSLRMRGAWGTLVFAGGVAKDGVSKMMPARRAAMRAARRADEAFDEQFGTDTAGRISTSKLDIESSDWVFGHGYQAASAEWLREVIGRLGIRHADYHFFDLGCGKARPVLVASDFPFARVVGVEWSPELVEVARKNLEVYAHPAQACRDIEVRRGDATTTALPAAPLVIYMYNPFTSEIMSRCIENIERRVEGGGGPVVVLYANPLHLDLWTASPAFRLLHTEEDLAVLVDRGHADGFPWRADE